MKKLFLIAFLFFFLPAINYAQTNRGGTPVSFSGAVTGDYVEKVLPKPDMKFIQEEDEADAKNGVLRKVGRSILVDINLNNSGSWETLPNGDRIWRLKIKAEGALALGVYYNHFWLPAGARMYLYNEDHSRVLGAYTQENNTESGLFATELMPGNAFTIEYFEPSRTKGFSVISISEIAYVYRDFKFGNNTKEFGDSESCEVNINCSEGTNWQDEKKGVARIFLKVGSSYGWCSGTLLNNQRQDCTPYMLTADHCGNGASTADLNQWVFYFNYEATGCPDPSGEPTSNSMTGCTLKAHGGNEGNSGSDFYLVQLSQAPTFNPYYNGWDKNNTPSSSGVSIHHPAGDIKKISTYTTALASAGWNGSGLQSHWRVVWAATANGHGVTEGGSSGSPIFNGSGQVVGDLTGGGSYCSAPTQPDYYGKFSYSWDQNGTTAATRLKDWLDPDNTGITTLNGFYCGSGTPVHADFSGTPTTVAVGGTVNFTDLSTGNPTTWSWTFTGGTPATANTQNPANIQYNTAGVYAVSLTVSNGTSSDTETKTAYITVGDPPPTANFVGTPTVIPVGGTVDFTDLSSGTPTSWAWTFTGGTPASANTQNPAGIQYNTAGIYPVSLTATNASGSDTETKNNYITVGDNAPIADFVANLTSIPVGGTVNFTDLSAGAPTSWAWTFTGGTPASSTVQNPTGIQYLAAGTYEVSLTATNAQGSDTETKTAYINVSGTGPGIKPCDTLHFPIPGNMVMYSVYYTSGVYGYVSGNNGYSDKAKADVFTAVAPHNKMVGAFFKFGKARNGSGQDYKIAVHAWDNSGPGGAPGNILFTDSLSCAQIQSDINMNTYTFLPFSAPYDVTGVFYLGIMLPKKPGDTIVLLTNKNGESMPGTAWEMWQNDNWLPYSNIASWSYNLSHAIFPVLCNPVTYSVAENKADDIRVYPNPANGIINIDFGNYFHENVVIKVYDLLGNEVKTFDYRGGSTNHLQMDLGCFANGFYVLHINTGEKSLVKKISLLK